MNIEIQKILKKHKLLRIIFAVLYISGCNPLYQRFQDKILATINMGSNMFILFMSLYEVFFNWNGLETISKCDTLVMQIQGSSKLIWFLLYKNKLLHVLEQLLYLWPKKRFHDTIQKKVNNVHRLVYLIIRNYLLITIPTIIMYTIKAYSERSLFYPGYEYCSLQSTICLISNTIFQIVVLILYQVPGIFCFDGIMLSLIGFAYCGFEMLEEAVKAIQFSATEDVKMCSVAQIVDQHNVLLRFIHSMDAIYAKLLLIQFWTTLSMSTACLFLLTYESIHPDLDHIAKYGSAYINLMLQSFMYCLAGTILILKVRRFSDVIYESKWYYDNQIQVRKSFILVIQRANKKECLSIGGMHDLSLGAFTSVFRNSFSIYTLLQTIRTSGDRY